MDDTLEVRDHRMPCEHGSRWSHWLEPTKARWWKDPDCPGGREIVLRRLEDGTWEEAEPPAGTD
jgi:hypothetical protein